MKTLELGGRRFPVVGVVCPPDPGGSERTDWDRSLGTGDSEYIVPAENGLLFYLSRDAHPGAAPGTWELWVHTLVCKLHYQQPDPPVYLPRLVGVRGGKLVVEDDGSLSPRATCFWLDAEEDWLVEHIDRLSRMPVPEASGPRVRLVDPDYLTTGHEA